SISTPPSGDHLDLHSFPTRRSSDLLGREYVDALLGQLGVQLAGEHRPVGLPDAGLQQPPHPGDLALQRRVRSAAFLVLPVRRHADRKSTRLNSSHVKISYAVFCLKK